MGRKKKEELEYVSEEYKPDPEEDEEESEDEEEIEEEPKKKPGKMKMEVVSKEEVRKQLELRRKQLEEELEQMKREEAYEIFYHELPQRLEAIEQSIIADQNYIKQIYSRLTELERQFSEMTIKKK